MSPTNVSHAVALRRFVWVDASANRVAAVYTSAPKRRREAISTDLCTLLRPHTAARTILASQQCTQMPRNGPERPF